MPAPFQTSRRVEFRDTDAAGILHFTAVLGLMEEAEHEFLRHIAVPLFRPVDGGTVSWPRVSAACDFKSPARFEDDLQIDVVVRQLGRRSVTYGFRVRCQDRLVATGTLSAACCLVNGSGIKSMDIPPDVADKLRMYLPT